MKETGSIHSVDLERLTASALLTSLNTELTSHKTEVEFYFLGGAVIFQAFAASPPTAHIDAMFQPGEVVRDATRRIATREALADDWVHECIRTLMGGGVDSEAYVELSHVRVFLPRPEYVLAVKCAARRLGDDFHEMEDARYVLRAMNVRSAHQALSVVTQYFTERQLAPDTRTALEGLIGA